MDTIAGSRYRWALLVGVIALVPLAVTTMATRQAPGVEWWRPVQVHSIRADNYATLSELARGADAVIVGKVATLQMGRSFVADPARGERGVARFAEVTFSIDEVISDPIGRLSGPSTLKIEIFLPTQKAYQLFAERMPASSSLVFLRHKGTEARTLGLDQATIADEDPFFRLVVREAVIADQTGLADAFTDAEDGYLRALNGQSFEKVVSEVRKAVGG